MDAQAWSRVNGVLDRLEDVEGAEREALLAAACRGDAALEALVREQLAAMAKVDEGFLGGAARTLRLQKGPPELHGYRIVKQVGRGGGGTVFEAEQTSAGRRVALKVLRAEDDGGGDLGRRLRREARVLAQLAAPGIATLFDVGSDRDVTWIAMEWIDGHDLAREIAMHSAGELDGETRPLLPGFDEEDWLIRRIELVAAVAEALHSAHERGVIHRDVKASNIMLTRTGVPKLVDFGLARTVTNETITESGVIAGSVHTMSPEQARGAALDRRTDVYSLGAVLFHLVSGRLPFSGRDALAVLRALEQGRTPRLAQVVPQLSADLDAVCAKAMAHAAQDRYPTAQAFAADLWRLTDGRPVEARPLGTLARLWRWLQRNRRAAVLLLGVSVAVAILARAARSAGQRAEWGATLATLERETEEQIAESNTEALLQLSAQLAVVEQRVRSMPALTQRAASLRSRVRAFGDTRAAEARAQLLAALAPPGAETQDLRTVFGARAALDAAQLLAREAAAPQPAGLSADFPSLSLASDAPGDTLDIANLDAVTGLVRGEARTVSLPVERLQLAPGNYRLTLRRAGFGTAELTRWFGEWGRHYDQGVVTLRASALLERDMVRIPSGTTHITVPLGSDGGFTQLAVAVPEFLLDPYEVTNGEYATFLASAADPKALAPPYWDLVIDRPGWSDLPVAGVTFYQARAYAEWAGKRLPTEPEWNRALEGTAQHLFPWGNDPTPRDSAFPKVDTTDWGKMPDEARVTLFLAALQPARTPTADRSIDFPALLHLAGNVAEWTESMALGDVEGRLFELPTHRRSKGWSWLGTRPSQLKQYVEVQASFVETPPSRGFRCARSIDHE